MFHLDTTTGVSDSNNAHPTMDLHRMSAAAGAGGRTLSSPDTSGASGDAVPRADNMTAVGKGVAESVVGPDTASGAVDEETMVAGKGVAEVEKVVYDQNGHERVVWSEEKKAGHVTAMEAMMAEVDGGDQNPVRSHFWDPRDPFLEDAQQTQSVVIRIVLSYLQVNRSRQLDVRVCLMCV